jgi:hypothetical protein
MSKQDSVMDIEPHQPSLRQPMTFSASVNGHAHAVVVIVEDVALRISRTERTRQPSDPPYGDPDVDLSSVPRKWAA